MPLQLTVEGDKAREIHLWWDDMTVEWSDLPEEPTYIYAGLRARGPVNGDEADALAVEYWFPSDQFGGFEKTDSMTVGWDSKPNGRLRADITDQMTAEEGEHESYRLTTTVDIRAEDADHNEIWSEHAFAGSVDVIVDNRQEDNDN